MQGKNIKSCSFDNIFSTSLQNTKGQLNQNGAVFIQNNQRSLFLQIKSSKGKPIRGPLSEKKLNSGKAYAVTSVINWVVLKLLFIPLCPLREVHKTQMSPYVSIMISLESAKGGLRILVRRQHTLPLLFTMITLHIMGFSSFML